VNDDHRAGLIINGEIDDLLEKFSLVTSVSHYESPNHRIQAVDDGNGTVRVSDGTDVIRYWKLVGALFETSRSRASGNILDGS
jgi:hypothetical protein